MENICMACGMPLDTMETIGLKTETEIFCKYCVDENKNVKKCEEIFEGGVQYFMSSIPNADRIMAEKFTRKNMNSLPYWQEKECECLKGEQATNEEYQKIFSNL